MGEYLPGNLQERLRELREAHGYSSRSKLADALGIDRTTYSRIEKGDTKTISSDLLIKLADLYNVSTDFILGLSDVPEKTYYEIDKLGLSVDAAKNLYMKKADPRVVNELLLNPKFHSLCCLLASYFSGQLSSMYAANNKLVNLSLGMLTQSIKSSDIINDKSMQELRQELQSSQVPTQLELDRIRNTFMACVKEIKEKIDTEISEICNQQMLSTDIISVVKKSILEQLENSELTENQKIAITTNAMKQAMALDQNMSQEQIEQLSDAFEDIARMMVNYGKETNES